jgi:hypothetical protein
VGGALDGLMAFVKWARNLWMNIHRLTGVNVRLNLSMSYQMNSKWITIKFILRVVGSETQSTPNDRDHLRKTKEQ